MTQLTPDVTVQRQLGGARRAAGDETSAGAPGLWLALLLGLALKTLILATGSVTFDSDEAIVALMARHITQGARPIFFYGQHYMGALDAYLISLAFLLLGQSVLVVRLVQLVLFMGVVGTTYALSSRLSQNRLAATAAALLVALPPVMVGVYTTATLGDYVEILLLGNLLLLAGWRMAESPDGGPFWLWGVWGFLAGLGWWSMSLVVVTAVPAAIYILRQHRSHLPWGRILVAALGAALGAAPWLAAAFHVGLAATLGAVSGGGPGEVLARLFAEWPTRVVSLFTFGLPALLGLRPPWNLDWIALPLGIPLAMVYLAALWAALRQPIDPPTRARRLTLAASWWLLALVMLGPLGFDPSGRYLLPLYPLLVTLLADWLIRLPRLRRLSLALVGVLLAYNLWGTLRAVRDNPPGLSAQFNPIAAIPEDHNGELLAFLDEIGVHSAYTHYWVAYRFAFLTGEQVCFSPRLPFHSDLRYSPRDDRIPAYTQAVDASPEVIYVTANHPLLDSVLVREFDALDVTYRQRQIGPYRVFYDLSRPVRPAELDVYSEITAAAPLTPFPANLSAFANCGG